nr:MAG TPA: hypothetical protein [Microviridae sp.]
MTKASPRVTIKAQETSDVYFGVKELRYERLF